MLDRKDLLERLRGLEWEDFEVKEASWEVPRNAYTTVSAFANTSGGWLVFGVKESPRGYEVSGLVDADKLQNDFLGTCRDTEKFSRPVDVRAKQYGLDDKLVLAFYVAPSHRFDKPIRVRVDKAWHTYIRVGARDQKCSEAEEARFFRDASTEDFDALVLEDAKLTDLDEASLGWLRGVIDQRLPERARPTLSVDQYLDEMGLTRDGKLTHAAAFLFGREKLLARLKPGGVADFRLIRAPWSESLPPQRYDDRELCEGNLVQTLRALLERVLRLVPAPFSVEPETMQRRAHPPEYLVLREALVNLLVHQDYSDRQRTARILWYDDRTVFENPGDSFLTLSQMLDGGGGELRNPLLVRVFRQAGYAEQAGTGIPSIVKTWREVDRKAPEIINDPGRKLYRLDLHWALRPKREDRYWKDLLGVSVSDDEAQILDLARGGAVFDRTRARLVTGRSARETALAIGRLLTNRLLDVVDGDRDQYRLASHLVERLEQEPLQPAGPAAGELAIRTGSRLVLTERQKAILAVLRESGPLSSAGIRQRFGEEVKARTIRNELIRLQTSGLVRLTGRGRGSRWEVVQGGQP